MPQSSSAANINVDINKIATDLNLKADTDLVNVPSNYDYVVESYNDGTNWYRKYKSGWLEQGGVYSGTFNMTSVHNLLIPFANTNYSILGEALDSYDYAVSWCARKTSFTATSFTGEGFRGTTGNYTYNTLRWEAKGQGPVPYGTAEVFSSTLSTSQTPVLLHLDGNNTNSGTASLGWSGNSFTFVSDGKFGQSAQLQDWYDFRGLNFSETDKYTVEYWAGASEDNAGTYFTWGTGSGPSAILSIAINHGKNEFIIKQGDNTIAYQSGLPSSTDKWHHTAFVYHGDSTFTFFIDGKKVDYTMSASGATSVYNCIFNGDSGKALFDEFVVHNYERYTKDFKLQTTPYTLE